MVYVNEETIDQATYKCCSELVARDNIEIKFTVNLKIAVIYTL
jgi:hypothetical protein